MATSPTILDSDFKYIDKKGNLLKTRTELTVAQMLAFLENEYEYNYEMTLKNGDKVKVDFKTAKGFIEVIDNFHHDPECCCVGIPSPGTRS